MSHIVIDARGISSSNGTYIEHLVHFLQKLDHSNQYTILTRYADRNFFRISSRNFKVGVADYGDYSLAEQTEFRKLLKKLAPDLVHFTTPMQPAFFNGKHVTTFHELTILRASSSDEGWVTFQAKQLVASFIYMLAAKKSNHIITPSNFTKCDLVNFSGISPNKISVIHEAADVLVKRIENYNHPFDEYILYVGQQSDYKNIRRLAEAHQKLLQEKPELGLILVGKRTGAILKNEEYFDRKGYKNILFTGFLSDAQRDWLYTNASAFVFPSLMEGFGLSGLEAMTYGTPVVSSDASCMPEIFGDAAQYFDPLSIDSMVRAIEEVLSSKELKDNLIQKGYARTKKYSWYRMAEQTLQVYCDILSKKPKT